MDVEKNVIPLGNRALVKRANAKKTKGGILLPEAAQETPRQGEVLAIGPGKRNDKGDLQAMHINVGDTVLFSSYAGTEVQQQEEDASYLIISEDDILGVLVQN